MHRLLPRWAEGRFEVEANSELLAQLTGDLQARGDALKPAPGWLLSEELVQGSMNDLLEPWCGAGSLPLSAVLEVASPSEIELLARFVKVYMVPFLERYARSIDHLGLLKDVTLRDLANANWRVLDLESLMDFLQLAAFFDFAKPNQVILEIGGGFGRLIEFIVLLTGQTFRYINIDAVPVSMMYCHQYLRARFPQRNVRIFDPHASNASNDCDFLIVPAWDLRDFFPGPVDLAINIESMQEMRQDLIDYYVSYLDKTVRDGGLIFLINSREHEFIGDWTFPDTWQCLFRHRTARSWSIDHPTEVFRKSSRDHRPQNLLRAAAFSQEVRYVELVKQLQARNKQRHNPHCIPNMLQDRR